MRTAIKRTAAAVSIVLATAGLFQNCSNTFLLEGMQTIDLSSMHDDKSPPASYQGAKYQPRMGDRFYITSTLHSIFVESATAANDRPARDAITFSITSRTDQFGGLCHLHNTACPNRTALGAREALALSSSSAPRSGWMIRVCEELTSMDRAVQVALKKAGLTEQSPVNSGNLFKVHQLFYLGQDLEGELERELLDMAARVSDPLGKWRFALFGLCLSPGWQML